MYKLAALTCLFLVACVAATSDATPSSAAPASAPTALASAAAASGTGFPTLDPLSATLTLPAEFAPTLSYVSPDGRFVAARGRDYGQVVLFRITPPSPRAPTLQLTPVADVGGFADQVSWLEDSSAVLVGTDLDPTHGIANHDSTGESQRVVILNTDGHVVVAPAIAREVLYHRASISPDGQWIPVAARCCRQQVLLLSRDGTAVRTVAGPTDPDDKVLGFAGWDRDGLVLYWEGARDNSALVAVTIDGEERYRIDAPAGQHIADWGVFASATDRSWQLLFVSGGMGSSFRAYFLLVGHEVRALPQPLQDPTYGPFASGNDILYVDRSGAMHRYQPRTNTDQEIALRIDPSRGPSIVGVSDRYFVWSELTKGYVADLTTGRTRPLPLQKTLHVSVVDGARLADYHIDDNAIVIFNLANVTAQ